MSNSEDVFIREGCRYPEIKVQLSGTDGNAWSILGAVGAALVKAGVSKAERAEFVHEAIKRDYNHLLETVVLWVDAR